MGPKEVKEMIAEILRFQEDAKEHLEKARNLLDQATGMINEVRPVTGERFIFDGELLVFKHKGIDVMNIQRLVGNHDWLEVEREIKVIK